MNIAFFGYDFFHETLKAILDSGHNLKWLFTYETDNEYNFNKNVIHYAAEVNSKIYFHKPTLEDVKHLKSEGCDLIISAAYAFKIPVYEGMVYGINIHPSLLPEGRGAWPLPWVILNGLSESGVTIHELSDKFDSGPVLLQRKFSISSNENLESLSCKCQLLSRKMITELLSDFESFKRDAKPQGKGSKWGYPSFEQRTLDWNQKVADIERVCRAFGKFDSIVNFDEKDWIVNDVVVWEEEHDDILGSVILRTNREIVFAAKDGYVCLRYYRLDPDQS